MQICFLMIETGLLDIISISPLRRNSRHIYNKISKNEKHWGNDFYFKVILEILRVANDQKLIFSDNVLLVIASQSH